MEKLKRVTEARKDSKIEQCIKTALEKCAKHAMKNLTATSFSSPIQLDDKQPSTGNSLFVLSIGARLGRSLHQDDSLSKVDLSEYMDKSSTSDSTTVPVDNNMTPTDTLVALSLSKEVHNDLLTHWIVDPRSNTHVINSKT